MARNRIQPEVNAGSMADIAFLLLIFFLVTTTIENDAGLNRILPDDVKDSKVKEKNLFRVSLNSNNGLLVEGALSDIKDLRAKTIAFLDNGGIKEGEGHCSYCKGKQDSRSSDNPKKAVISLSNTRGTNYGVYVAVQNELVAAYNELRDREALRMYKVSYAKLMQKYEETHISHTEKAEMKNKIESVRLLFPQKISEAQITNN